MIAIIKSTPPTEYDCTSQAAVCIVIEEGSNHIKSLYIQVSDATESPNWVPMGTFLQISLANFIFNDDEFISECIRLFFANYKESVKLDVNLIPSDDEEKLN